MITSHSIHKHYSILVTVQCTGHFKIFKDNFQIQNGFPGGSNGKESAYNAGDLGSVLGLGRSPGEGNGNLLQYSCLENSLNRGAWQAIVYPDAGKD